RAGRGRTNHICSAGVIRGGDREIHNCAAFAGVSAGDDVRGATNCWRHVVRHGHGEYGSGQMGDLWRAGDVEADREPATRGCTVQVVSEIFCRSSSTATQYWSPKRAIEV